jgi:hypothetical protein
MIAAIISRTTGRLGWGDENYRNCSGDTVGLIHKNYFTVSTRYSQIVYNMADTGDPSC